MSKQVDNSYPDRHRGVVALVVLTFVFASMGLFARYLSTDFTVLQQVYLRVMAAFVIGIIVFAKDIDYRKLPKIKSREWGLIIFRSATTYLIGVTLFTTAIINTKYSNVSFIGALPMVAILGVILLRERLTAKKAVLITASFVGVLMLAVRDYQHIFQWGYGELIALLATVSFAISYVSRKWHANLMNNKEMTVITFFVSFILVLVTSFLFGEGVPQSGWSYQIIAAIVGAGVFNVANLFLTNYGFQKVEAILASNILTLESVIAVGLGLIFYREIPTIKELVGGAIIVASVILLNKVEAEE